MGEGKDTRKVIGEFKKKLQRDLKVDKIIFFGSRATGKAGKYSDIDLIVVSPDFKGKDHFERTTKMYDYWDSDLPVDFLCYTPEEFKKLKGRVSIVSEALKKGEALIQG